MRPSYLSYTGRQQAQARLGMELIAATGGSLQEQRLKSILIPSLQSSVQPKRYRCVPSNDQATEEDTAKDRQVVSHIVCHDRQHAMHSSAQQTAWNKGE